MFECKNLQELVAWAHRENVSPVLVAVDVGGTNTRLILTPASSSDLHLTAQCKVKISSKPALLAFFAEAAGALDGIAVGGAALCGPGPRNASGTQLGPFSNYKGKTTAEKVLNLSDLPTALFPSGRTRMLNDLEAGSYGLVALGQTDVFAQCFTKMWGSAGVGLRLANGPFLVLAPGTGLGTGLIYLSGGRPVVMPLEFGHCSVVCDSADPFTNLVKEKVQRGDKPPEYDDICAGRGLVWAWESLTKGRSDMPQLKEPGDVAKRALQGGCGLAWEALSLYYKYLFRLASDLCMGFQLGGVLVIGDNVRHNAKFLGDPGAVKQLRGEFMSHTTERMGFMSRATVLRQTSPHNLNLDGLVYVARGELRGAKL
eukprot:Hpha_TRINITY_DN16403_c0_g3::TRINITY_DN16403_c0_g3_i2::g.159187::m.159187/K00845/glk; glucokinase